MEQEHRITYKAGITRNPSDFLCQDGELAECINLATDSEELKTMVQPEDMMAIDILSSGANVDQRLLYVHRQNENARYVIGKNTNAATGTTWKISWKTADGVVTPLLKNRQDLNSQLEVTQAGLQITSVGRTLIITDTDGMNYFKWEADHYTYIKYPLPDLEFEARLVSATDGTAGNVVRNSQNPDGVIEYEPDQTMDPTDTGYLYIKEGQQEEYNNLVVGLYAKNLKQIAQDKRFAEPFLVRAALEMYDGSYNYITNPILLYPAITNNSRLYLESEADEPKEAILVTQSLRLFVKQSRSFSDYEDLVKDVVVFASKGVPIYKTSCDQRFSESQDTTIGECVSSYLLSPSIRRTITFVPSPSRADRHINTGTLRCLTKRDAADIKSDLESTSVFYKIASLGLKSTDGYIDIATKTTSDTMENLTTQDRLDADDFYSRNRLLPRFSYSYNQRLNISNVRRGFFEGFDFFMPFDDSANSYNYYFYVTVRTDDGTEITVCHTKNTSQKQGIWFFYPDPRASHVKIFKLVESAYYKILDEELKEHSFLHGAYYFAGFDNLTEEPQGSVVSSLPSYDNGAMESLLNYLLQSEVSNPYLFLATGYHRVGVGRILGMSAITMALSQDQFGHTDLVVFSDRGIWGMMVDGTGLYQSIHPFTRDVCINPGSIIQTDYAIFFVSKKGLMALTDEGVRCVSERMNGLAFDTSSLISFSSDDPDHPTPDPADDWKAAIKACQTSRSFLDYIRDGACFMAYDYIDSRIYIVNPAYGFAFVYCTADGTISKAILPTRMTNAVNDYPDYLLQGVVMEEVQSVEVPVQHVYSFYGKQREEEVADRQLGFLLTRPMKLAGPVSKTSLRQLMNVGMWNKAGGSAVKTEIYLSDDLQTWYPDISRFGAAAKYYRLALYVKMLPTERLSGTILTEQPRRTNNFR